MGITGQNMPQSSNSLLSPIKSIIARATNGNQGQIMMHYQTPIMGITGQNMPQTSNSLLSPMNLMVARGNQW